VSRLINYSWVKGVVVDCDDCREPHFFAWDLMRANLRHLLVAGRTRVHEPAFDPDPSEYVTWEYARGYADGVQDAVDENEDPVVDKKGDTLRRLQLLRRLQCKLQAPASTPVPRSPLQPGEEVEVRVPLAAPSEVGEFKGYWRLQNLEGKRFGPLMSLKIRVSPASETSSHSLTGSNRFSSSGSNLRDAFIPPAAVTSDRKSVAAGDGQLTPQLEKIWADKFRQLQERKGVVSANAPKTNR